MLVAIRRIIFYLVLSIPISNILLSQTLKNEQVSIHINDLIDVSKFLFIAPIISLLCMFTGLFLLIKKQPVTYNINKHHLFLLAFCIYCIINYLLFCNLSDNATHHYCLYFLSVIILYISFTIITPAQLNLLRYGVMVIHLTIVIWAGLQLVQFIKSPILYAATGPFSNSGDLGNFLVCTFPFLLFPIKTEKNKKQYLVGVLYLCNLAILMAIVARIALIAHIITGCLLLFPHFKKKIILIISFIILLVTISFLLHLKQGSNNGRQLIYKASLIIFKEHPVMGIGVNNFRLLYNRYQSAYIKEYDPAEKNYADNTYMPFNEYLLLLIEVGLIGFVLLGGTLYYWIKQKVHLTALHQPSYATAVLSLLATAICAIASYPLQNILIVYAVLLAIKIMAGSPQRKPVVLGTTIPATLLILAGITGAIFTCLQWNATLHWQKAANAALANDQAVAVKGYKAAYKVYYGNGAFLYNYGAEMVLQDKATSGLALLSEAEKYYSNSNLSLYTGDACFRLGDFFHAEAYYLQAVNAVPSRIYYKYKLAKFYIATNNIPMAKKWARIIIDYPVKTQNKMAYQMKEEMDQFYKSW